MIPALAAVHAAASAFALSRVDVAEHYRRVVAIIEESGTKRPGRAFGHGLKNADVLSMVSAELANAMESAEGLPAKQVYAWARTQVTIAYYNADPFRGAEWKPV